MILGDSMMRLLRRLRFSGKARLFEFFSPRRGEVRTTIYGAEVALDLADLIQRRIYLGCFESHESRALERCLKPGMTFLDVGANIGYFTFLAASRVGEAGRVVALEPSPYAYERLVNAVAFNRHDHVKVYNAAAGDAAGKLPLFLPSCVGNHSPSLVPHGTVQAVEVSVLVLDDFLPKIGVDHIDAIKIDVEGFEPNVIRGLAQYMEAGRVDVVLCEFHEIWLSQNGSSRGKLYDMFESLGFRTRRGRVDLDRPIENLLFKRRW